MNKRLFLSFLLIIAFIVKTNAQAPSRINISGHISDTLGADVLFATVMLLSPADSSLQNFTTSNEKGNFSFNNVKNTSYLLKISHVSYIPLQQAISPSESKNLELTNVVMKPMSSTLMEVVVKAAKAPLRVRGDTIEYDATTFKIAPGSNVEDLLRRLPGLEVDADGNISTQGKNVKRMYVDGKTFFGNDPKSVTKNIGAEAISKVQVFDEKSEQSKLTGIDDGSKEKAMNLELKSQYKKGSFGKLTIAGGTEERAAARGNYNRFDDKNQLSFIGYANNINETGVNWEDYSEFKGNNAFNEYDNGDFGFESRNRNIYMFSGSGIMSSYNGRGFTKNFGGGTNYNYDDKKNKVNASYTYNQTALDYLQNIFRQTTIDSANKFNKYDTITNNGFVFNHIVGTRFERDFDSSNKIIAKANATFSGKDDNNVQIQQFTDNKLIDLNKMNISTISKFSTSTVTSTAIYRHLFKKKGRSFSVSGAFNYKNDDKINDLENMNDFFNAMTPDEEIKQQIKGLSVEQEIKSSVLYTEPITKKIFLEFFGNFSTFTQNTNNQVNNSMLGNQRIDSLSNYFETNTLYNRGGAVFRYSYNGLNVAIGSAVENVNKTAKTALDKSQPWYDSLHFDKTSSYFIPNVSINYEFARNAHFTLDYEKNVTPPSFFTLQPIKNTTNPAYQVEGNLDLSPEKTHAISGNVNYWNSSSFASFGLGTNYSITENPIIYSQNNKFVPELGFVNISKPIHLKNKTDLSGWLWSYFQIIKTKLTANVSGNIGLSKSPNMFNDVEDISRTTRVSFYERTSLTLGQKLLLSVGGNIRFNFSKFENNEIYNQNYMDYSLNSSVKWEFLSKTYLESNFVYQVYKSEKTTDIKPMPLLNASIRRLLGKSNKFEVRLAAFDLFNKNLTIGQYASYNYIQTSYTNTLSRYFMLSVTYNMKGFETQLRNRSHF